MMSSPAPPAVESGEATRARILEVARELFATQGFAATSTRELSERLGFTKAALYYYFRTKDDLLTALLEPLRTPMATLVAQTPLSCSPAARRAVLVAYVDVVVENLDLIRVLTQDPSVAHRPASLAQAPLYRRIVQLLCGTDTPDVAQQARARAALGAIRAGLVRADPEQDSQIVRDATLAAACGALGVPAPRAGRPG